MCIRDRAQHAQRSHGGTRKPMCCVDFKIFWARAAVRHSLTYIVCTMYPMVAVWAYPCYVGHLPIACARDSDVTQVTPFGVGT
eukprot:2278723-Amphidinium_carterae.1